METASEQEHISHSATPTNPSLERTSPPSTTRRKVENKLRGGLRVPSQNSAGSAERVRCVDLITQCDSAVIPALKLHTGPCSCKTDEVEHQVLCIVGRRAARNVFFQPRGLFSNQSGKMQPLHTHPSDELPHCLSCSIKFHCRGDPLTPPIQGVALRGGGFESVHGSTFLAARIEPKEETHRAERLMCVPPVQPINGGSVFGSHGGETGLTTPAPPPPHPHNPPPHAKEPPD